MSEDSFDDTEHDERNPLRSVVRDLEAKNKALAEQLSTSAAAARELAFMKAGINPDDPKAKYFVKAYDGELEIDKIKSEATEAGLLAPQPRTTATPAEQQGMARFNEAAAGAQGPQVPAELVEKINAAKSEKEVLALIASAQQTANPY